MQIVEDLLAKGARANIKNKEGRTAYDVAIHNKKSDIAYVLSKSKRDILNESRNTLPLPSESASAAFSGANYKQEYEALILENQRLYTKMKVNIQSNEVNS